MDPEEAPSVLAVLLDLHAEGWQTRSKVPLNQVVPALLVLLNAHLAQDSGNELLVYGYNGVGARLLYPPRSAGGPPSTEAAGAPQLEGTMMPQFRTVDTKVFAAITQMASEQSTQTTSVAGALSLALASLNRRVTAKPARRGHILVVSAESNNVGAKYIAAMNSIFSAQKLKVPIDAASFGPPKSFLQQAAHFTNGAYLDVTSGGGLAQTFLSVFAVEPSIRSFVNLPTSPHVNFSAVCFVSKNVVQIGYVCSVCLCIMESVASACPVCHTPLV